VEDLEISRKDLIAAILRICHELKKEEEKTPRKLLRLFAARLIRAHRSTVSPADIVNYVESLMRDVASGHNTATGTPFVSSSLLDLSGLEIEAMKEGLYSMLGRFFLYSETPAFATRVEFVRNAVGPTPRGEDK